MSAVWELLKNDRFEEACQKATEEWLSTGSTFPLRNKVFALLQLGRAQEAIELCGEIIAQDQGRSDSDFIFKGVAYWLQDMSQEAINVWRSGTRTKYTDEAGGVEIFLMIYFAAIRAGDKTQEHFAAESINRILDSHGEMSWPAWLGYFALERVSIDELLLKVSPKPILREKQLCQAYFHISVRYLKIGDRNSFIHYCTLSRSLGSLTYSKAEFYLASHEIQKKP